MYLLVLPWVQDEREYQVYRFCLCDVLFCGAPLFCTSFMFSISRDSPLNVNERASNSHCLNYFLYIEIKTGWRKTPPRVARWSPASPPPRETERDIERESRALSTPTTVARHMKNAFRS